MSHKKCQMTIAGLDRVRVAAFVVFVVAVLPCHAQKTKPVRILMVGDSTMATYAKPPADRPDLTGWGQVFGEEFVDRVKVINKARSGRSSKSFLREGAWDDALKTGGDYVFIQFGHNDQPGKGDRTTDPEGDYRDNLRRYIKEARDKGMRPILVTPVARRTFKDGKITSTLGPYVEAVIAVGEAEKVPVIDLHAASMALFDKLGDAGSADLSASSSDRTHFSRKGAETIAALVAEEVRKKVSELKPLLKPADAGDDSMAELIRALKEQEKRRLATVNASN